MLEFENVELRFTDEALEAIAEEALDRNVGARGLRIILEELMLDVMYHDPLRRRHRGVRHHAGRGQASHEPDHDPAQGGIRAGSPRAARLAPGTRKEEPRS